MEFSILRADLAEFPETGLAARSRLIVALGLKAGV
jgi:hypothetical protein